MYSVKPTILLLVLILCFNFHSSAQKYETVWVTVNDPNVLPTKVNGKLQSSNPNFQKVIANNKVIDIQRALPAAKTPSLQNVFEMKCEGDALKLKTELKNSIEGLVDPEIGPRYELLSEPNDYHAVFTNDYALDLINAQTAWDFSTGDPGTIIGISDDNFDVNHEEFVGKNLSINNLNLSGSTIHGTAVALTAAGATNNGIGKSAIGYNCGLSLVRYDYNRVLELSQQGVRVINLSWASNCSFSGYEQQVIDEMYANGTIIVAAAGNGGTCGGPGNLVYPASYNHVISVTSIGPQDNHERFIGDPNSTHQHNAYVDLSAPGYDVAMSTAPGYYHTGNGSSFAAPYVAGTIGLMLSIKPCLTFEDIELILDSTVIHIDDLNPAYAGKLGTGRLDAGAALALTVNYTCQNGNQGGNGNNGGGGNGNNGGGNGNNGGGSGNNGPHERPEFNEHGPKDPPVIHHPGNLGDFDIEYLDQVQVFPVPSNGLVNVRFNTEMNIDEINVYNAYGAIVQRLDVSTGAEQFTMDQPGVYQIVFIKGGVPITSKRCVITR